MLWRPILRGAGDADARTLRLGYGLNLHAPRTLDEALQALRDVTVPLRERVAPRSRFGVGVYLPAELATSLASSSGAGELERLARFLAEHALDPFTYNAFPYGGFQEDGLKERVFAPDWTTRERAEYTLAVARCALAIGSSTGFPRTHVSVSTHAGAFGALAEGSAREGAAIARLAGTALELARLRDASPDAPPVVLALEPEPRSSANDLAELERWWPRLLDRGVRFLAREHRVAPSRAEAIVREHLGTCVDACHAAVEFESADVVDDVLDGRARGTLAKLQFSSALRVREPARNAEGRDALLALDEPRYLHQVTGRTSAGELLRARDLGLVRPELARWLACDEWRCHFHVPVDLDEARDATGRPIGLSTTRELADRMLEQKLATPTWAREELHLEIETYTWAVLPSAVLLNSGRSRGAEGTTGRAEELLDGLEREYRHVLGVLERSGWEPAPPEAALGRG